MASGISGHTQMFHFQIILTRIFQEKEKILQESHRQCFSLFISVLLLHCKEVTGTFNKAN